MEAEKGTPSGGIFPYRAGEGSDQPANAQMRTVPTRARPASPKTPEMAFPLGPGWRVFKSSCRPGPNPLQANKQLHLHVYSPVQPLIQANKHAQRGHDQELRCQAAVLG